MTALLITLSIILSLAIFFGQKKMNSSTSDHHAVLGPLIIAGDMMKEGRKIGKISFMSKLYILNSNVEIAVEFMLCTLAHPCFVS